MNMLPPRGRGTPREFVRHCPFGLQLARGTVRPAPFPYDTPPEMQVLKPTSVGAGIRVGVVAAEFTVEGLLRALTANAAA